MNTLTIGQKKYRVDSKKFTRGIIIILFSLILSVMVFQKLIGNEKNKNQTTTAIPLANIVVERSAELETIEVKITQPVKAEVVTAKAATIMSEKKFVKQVTGKFSQLTDEMAANIYKEAIKNGLPPYVSLGIAWQESKFVTDAIGPTTKYGTARGLYQVIESSAKIYLGIDTPEALYEPTVAITGGNKLLGIYRDWLSGIVDSKTPKVFKNFSVEGNEVLYKDKVIRDQKGEAVPLLLMTALSYNAGPGIISAAMDQDGMLVIDPKLKNCNIPIQSLDYALSINQNVFNFQYKFDYDLDDIDRAKIL
jgi:hypothetical protein